MSVRVALAALLAERIGEPKELELDGASVEEALRDLSGRYDALTSLLWKPSGEFNPLLVVFLNDTDIRDLEGLATPLKPGDQLTVVSALEGG